MQSDKEEEMAKVISTVPRSRFERFGIFFPDEWDVVYLGKPEEILAHPEVMDADFLFVMSSHIVTAEVINSMPNLKLIQTEGVAFNAVDREAATARDIPICNNRACNSGSVAEHTVGLMLAALRRTAYVDHEIKCGRYAECAKKEDNRPTLELFSQHVGIVGLGAIGKEVAKRLKPFGCKVSYFDVYRPSEEVEKELGVEFLELEDILKECTIITIHVPVLTNTEGFIGEADIAKMKQDAILINTSRGQVLDQRAVAKAVADGKIIAAIDTLYPEPPQGDSLAWIEIPEEAHDRITLTPHIGGTTDEAFTRMLVGARTNIQNVIDGVPVNNRTN